MISPWQKEWNCVIKKEQAYLRRASEKKSSVLDDMLSDKVPKKLQDTLAAAFAKAFALIFEKGTPVIEKTYQRDKLQRQFKVNRYAVELKEDRKGLRQFSRQANRSTRINLLLSGVEGIGLGVLGIGLPDIPVFTSMLLKSIYEIALHHGYDYENEGEQYFVLLLIQTALSHSPELESGNEELNEFITTGSLPPDYSQQVQIEQAAAALSGQLLYMKFLQGIPLLGTVGGAYNPIYLQRVQGYAKLKYQRRFLYDHRHRSTYPQVQDTRTTAR